VIFQPDPVQQAVLDHVRGPLLVNGGPGTGKTAVLRERFARLIERGAEPERVALVVRTSRARTETRDVLLARLAERSLPGLQVLTFHALAHRVLGQRWEALGYPEAPVVLSSADQAGRVRDLLDGEDDPAAWPVYGTMLPLRGFADQLRQFVLRAQEALLTPEDVSARAEARGLAGWLEVAAFYRRYLDVLGEESEVDFAGLLVQAAAGASKGGPAFDHLLVDDYQDATFAAERLLVDLAPESLVVAGDPGAHVFSFQGSTNVPLDRFAELAGAQRLDLAVNHRSPNGLVAEARCTPHTSDEFALVASELRRAHVEDEVSWGSLAVVVRRLGTQVEGLLRALDDARVPRSAPEAGLALPAEPAVVPFVLAMRWIARPSAREDLAEALLTSDVVGLSPAVARGLVRAARANGVSPAALLASDAAFPLEPSSEARQLELGAEEEDEPDRPVLTPEERAALASARSVLAAAEARTSSVVDAFGALWRGLPYAARLVEAGEAGGDSWQGRSDLDAVVAFAGAVTRASERPDASVEAFLLALEGGPDAPGLWPDLPWTGAGAGAGEAVHVLTAHGAAGREFDTVVVVGAEEGSFPSLSRPEPMFDLGILERDVSQSERNRLRLEDERRLFDVVASRARRRVLFTAGDAPGEDPAASSRSRFVAAAGVTWQDERLPADRTPLTVAEAAGAWRRVLATRSASPGRRLAALDGLLSLGEEPDRWWFQRDWTGTDRPLHEHLRVSYSKLDRLDNCELQFVLGEELGLEGRSGFYAWVGHLVHRIIEDCEKGEVERSTEALVAAAEERWQPEQFPSFAVSEAFRRLVTRTVLPAWMREYGETAALATEMGFEFEFAGATVRGFIDRIGAAGEGSQITDYKTGKARNAAKAEENLQLGMYYLAVQHTDALAEFRPVKSVELAFLRDNVRGEIARTAMCFTKDNEPEYLAMMTERLTGLIERLAGLYRDEVYRPSPEAKCRVCDFKQLCPLWPEGGEVFPLRVEVVGS